MLWPLARVPMYPHSCSIHKLALLGVLEPLQANVVEEQEGMLTYTLALVVKLTTRDLPLFRAGVVMTLQCGGLVAMSHDLSHHKQVQLIIAHLSKGAVAVRD